MIRILPAALLWATLCPWCAAGVGITFPLQGYYRPGKYMPVRMSTDDAPGAPLVLRAEGAVAVSVGGGGGGNAVVPWLVVDGAKAPRWHIDGAGEGTVAVSLKALEPGQALVVVTGADPGAATAAASRLFPGRTVVPVLLSATPPLSGDPAAWESLDAAVFDTSPGEELLSGLIGEGVSVVVRSTQPPAGVWPWQGGSGAWFVTSESTGPALTLAEAYEPVGAWRPGWPVALRHRALFLAVGFCIAALAATLCRHRWQAALAVVTVCCLATAAFAWWGDRQERVCSATGVVRVVGERTTQTDAWTYIRPLAAGTVHVGWHGNRKPVFASAAHLRDTDLRLDCGPGGRPVGFNWQAKAGRTLAFLTRSVALDVEYPNRPVDAPPRPPMSDLAAACYLQPGDEMTGDPASAGDDADNAGWSTTWPAVTVVRHR